MAEWVKLGDRDDFEDGFGTCVEVAGHRIAVFNVNGDLYAIGDRCSHAEASLAEGELFDFDVECPRHGSEFDVRTGKPGSLPATRSVPVYELSIDGGTVTVLLEPEGDS
jgi:3-phenylpropionate/trans-cinnamate dioxygenase ferredoxin subunit